MRKLLVSLLALVMVITLTGCGGGGKTEFDPIAEFFVVAT